MIYGSVCSGIEAATVAWHPLGWKPAWFSEIEPFPCAVLAHHYPETPNRGDMTKFKEWENDGIDVLVGGTPCQSFSVAGLRKGLDDPRGNLMLTYLAIVAKYRPAWLVWENVPGVLSSNAGRDFGTFLAGLGELGYGFAYRILDAQHFGVPQRRRRVFVVGYLGDWRRAAAVLFERHSLSGDSAPRREAREGTAVGGALSVALRGREGGGTAELGDDIGLTLRASSGGGDKPHALVAGTIAHTLRGDGFDASEDGSGRGTPLVPISFPWQQGGTMGFNATENLSGSLIKNQTMAVAFDTTQITSAANYSNPQPGDPCHPLAAGAHAPAIAFSAKDYGGDAMHELSPTLRAGGHNTSHANAGVMPAIAFPANLSDTQHASTQETNAGKILRALREAVGEEAFAKWGLGILDSLQSPEILRQALHGLGFRPASFTRSWVVHCALSRQEDGPGWLLQSLRETGCEGCPPQGWEPPEQLARQLGAYLSELSQPGAQATRFMRDLWWAAQGAGVLRQALSAIQEVGRPAYGQSQPAYGGMQVRRLTVEECEFLQGFPRGYTAIPWRGKPADQCPDGPRYKALGNSMAVPVMFYIGKRIQLVEESLNGRDTQTRFA